MSPSDVLVVGASVAGVRVAQTLRRKKFDGRIRLLDAESGLPYDKPILSKEALTGSADLPPLISEGQLADLGIELLHERRATALDVAERTLDTSTGELSWEGLVIATGAEARAIPAFAGTEGVHHLRTRADAEGLRRAFGDTRHLVIVGGGFIGGEIASSARHHDIDVTIVEAAPRLLSRSMPSEVGDAVAELHRSRGVKVLLGTTVVGVIGEKRIEGLELSNGATLATDTVVVGIGARPCTDWLEGSGLVLDDGVVCDEDLRAEGTDRVWAVGDVARWRDPLTGRHRRLEHWTAAREQAALVAANIAAGERAAFSTTEYVWSDQHGIRIQHVGHVGSRTGRSPARGEGTLFIHREDGEVVGATAFDAAHDLLAVRRTLTAALAARRPMPLAGG